MTPAPMTAAAPKHVDSAGAALVASTPSAAFKDRIVLTCTGVHQRFGAKNVLHDIHLEIGRGQIVALVGPSGCGKTTLLNAILGSHKPTSGTIVTHSSRGETLPVDGLSRDRGIVYQRYSLQPQFTAQENVALGLQFQDTTMFERFFRPMRFRSKQRDHRREAANLLQEFGLGEALERYPTAMSGGMCQRVAIAQALITKPRILLLDEPFGALDEATRRDMQRMLLRIYQINLEARKRGEIPPYTVVIVTHELTEALIVGDRVIGISQFWDWKSVGKYDRHPGATIVYDDAAPVCTPDAIPDNDFFKAQREEIHETVFNPSETRLAADNIRFWERVAAGDVEGVMGL